jgi:murein DD-endopeptidase MepM/ murein hydrolase activator NlpD
LGALKDIKTKTTVKDIKALDKSLDVTRRAKNTFIRTKDQAERTQRPEDDSYVAHAGDKARDSAETVGNEAVHTIGRQGQKAVQKIKKRRNSPSDSHHADAADGHATEQTSSPSETGRPPTRRSAVSQGRQPASHKAGKAPAQSQSPAQANPSARRKAVPLKVTERGKRKYTLAKPNELAKRRFVQSRTKARFTLNREIQAAETKTAPQAIPSPVFRSGGNTTRHTTPIGIGGTGRTVQQSARSSSKAVKETARVTIKTAQKSVKTAGQTAKAGAKTSPMAAKTAAQTVRTTAKAAQRAAQTARATAKFTIHMMKLTLKAAAVLTKGLIALTGSSGAVLALFLIIIAVAALLSSPFGLLFSDENKDAGVTPVSTVIQEVNEEYNQRIEEIKNDNTWDTLNVQYVGTGGSRGNIWIDILAVFAVKTALTEDGMDVVTIDQTRVDLIREVFWDMTEIDHWIETVAHTDSDGETWYERILHIVITQRTAGEQAEVYRFNYDQREVLEDLLSGDYDQYFIALITGLRHLGDGTAVIAEGLYIWPSAASDYVTSFFGTRLHPILGVYKTHSGIDIGAGYGTAILAAADGVVTTAAYDAGGYGNYLIIDHGNSNLTLYAHLSQMSAGVGQTVKQGQTIGLVGSTGLSTGPHLHFEVYVGGTRVDPLLYFSNYTAAW